MNDTMCVENMRVPKKKRLRYSFCDQGMLLFQTCAGVVFGGVEPGQRHAGRNSKPAAPQDNHARGELLLVGRARRLDETRAADMALRHSCMGPQLQRCCCFL